MGSEKVILQENQLYPAANLALSTQLEFCFTEENSKENSQEESKENSEENS